MGQDPWLWDPSPFLGDVSLQEVHLSILVQRAEELGSLITAAAFTRWCTASPGWGEAWRGGDSCGPVKGSPAAVPAAVVPRWVQHGAGMAALPPRYSRVLACACSGVGAGRACRGNASTCFVRGAGWNQCRGLQSSPVSASPEPPCCSLFHQRLET